MPNKTFPGIERIFGQLLRRERIGAKLTQVQLGRLIGRPANFIGRLEAGKQRIWMVDLVLIVRALGLEVAQVLDELTKGGSGE